VRFYMIVLDIDGPNHTCPDDWYADQIDRLRGTPWEGSILYRTKGGFRLAWELPEPLKIHEYMNLLAALWDKMEEIGIRMDRFTDWNRSYRLPYVKRDGKRQNLELVIPENPMFPVSLLTFSRVEEVVTSLGAKVAATQLKLSTEHAEDIGQHSRNNMLFRMLSSLRNLAWLDEELALSFALSMNQERCNPPLDENEVTALVRNVWSRYDAGELELPEAPDENAIDKTQIIVTGGDLDAHVHTCIEALCKHPDIYVRQGRLTRVIAGSMQDLPRHALRTCLAEVADFFKMKKTETGFVEISIDPPKDLVDCVYEQGLYGDMRELEQIRTLPAIRPDGIVINGHGYDLGTRTLFLPEFTVDMPLVTYAEAVAAKDRIKELYCNFPFFEPCHKAAAIAALMTPVLRLSIKGPTPMFIFESPVPSSGKTKLGEIVAIVATGEGPAVMAPSNEEETQKQITSQLLNGAKVIFIDNVERPIGGPSLDAALTSEWWSARLMKSNTMLRLKNGATWMVTGNNIQLMGDIARRAIRIFINPDMENPEERDPKSFRFPKITQHVLEHREEIVRDILIMALARFQAPDFEVSKSMGSFESWSFWVRETLMYLGEADCLDTQVALKSNASVGTFGNLITCAFSVFQPKGSRSFVASAPFTAKDMWSVIFEGNRVAGSSDHNNGLMSAYQEMTDDTTLRNCARLLNRWTHRIVAGHKIVALPRDPIKGIQFQIIKVGEEKHDTVLVTGHGVPEHRQGSVAGVGQAAAQAAAVGA